MINDFLDALSEDEFEDTPVDLDTFMYDKKYLGRSYGGSNKIILSPIQREIIERGSDIYNHDTNVKLYGLERANKLLEDRVRYLLLMLGKGSGKDFMTRIICAYITHKLLCLRDPSGYFGKPTGEEISLVNLALDANQASTVFFGPLKKMLERSEWFSERIVNPHIKDIEFKKDIFLYSMHSNPEAAEGKNVIVAVLDEIDGFTVEGASEGMFTYLEQAVVSRFAENGKVIALSFPRSKDGWIFTKYDEVVGKNKNVVTHTHVFKLNNNLPDGTEGNEFTVTWTEDEVTGYEEDNWFALKAPTFRVNPGVKLENYKGVFLGDLKRGTSETLMRVCANPPDHNSESFFKDHAMLENVFSHMNGWDEENQAFKYNGDDRFEYFIHVDLSKVSDRTVVALAHVDHWKAIQIGDSIEGDVKPHVVIDLFRVWEPTPNKHVNNAEVADFILEINARFNLRLVTFDRWGSIDMIKYLNDRGVEAERLSLERKHYMEFRLAAQDGRLQGPEDKRLLKELKNLILNKVGKVDHPDGKEHFNDISEACCGSIFNCVAYAMDEFDVRVETADTLKLERLHERENRDRLLVADKQEMDGGLADFLQGLGVL